MKHKIFLSTFYYQPELGGIENYLADVLRISPRGFIVSKPYFGYESKRILCSEVEDIYCYVGFKSLIRKNKKYFKWLLPFIYINQFFSGLGVLSRRRSEIGAIYAGSGDFVIAPLVLSKLFRLPLVTFVYGNDIQQKQSIFSKIYKGKMLLYMLSLSKVVVAISHYTVSILKRGGYRNNNIILLNPFLSDVSIGSIKPRNMSEYERDGFVLLTIGRIVQRKGYESILYALKVVKDKGIDFKYRIVGDGPYRNEVLRIIDTLGLQSCVELLGVVDDIDPFYQEADVFIMPSIELPGDVEGFGIVFLEAGLRSVPVIASLSGGIPDAVVDGETGLLVTPGDVDEIADAIILLMGDAALRMRMGRAGYRRATERAPILLAIDNIEARISNGVAA